MATTNKRTRQECIDLLIGLYKREIFDVKYHATQKRFDEYVADFCKYGERSIEKLTDEELLECTENALEYDGFDYLENEDDLDDLDD